MTDDVGVLARLDAVACDDLTRARWNQAGRRRVGRQAVGRLESFACFRYQDKHRQRGTTLSQVAAWGYRWYFETCREFVAKEKGICAICKRQLVLPYNLFNVRNVYGDAKLRCAH